MPQDTPTLLTFLEALEYQVFLPLLEEHPRLLRQDLLPAVRKAWPEVQHSLLSLRNALKETLGRPDASIRRALEEVGLWGIQLDLKLQGFFGALERKTRRWRNSIVRWFREVLAWANVILGSLARVLSAAEVIKEYKECVEVAMDYSGKASRRE